MKNLFAVLILCSSALAQTAMSGSGGISASNVTFSSAGTVGVVVTVTTSCNPLPQGTELTPYSQQFAASGGASPYSWTITTGSIPSGLSFPTTGLLAGTPASGSSGSSPYSFSVQATDANNNQSSPASCSLTIQPSGVPPVMITSTSPLPSCFANLSCSFTFTASGGVPPYTWAQCSGTLPNGESLNASTGVLSGTPTVVQTFGFGIEASDSTTPTPLNSGCISFQQTINSTPATGPPTYNGSRTDLATAWPPVNIPNVGNRTGLNTIITDPDFSNRIVRVTDTLNPISNTKSWWQDCGGSSQENGWNSDSTMFLVMNEGCSTFPVAFNLTGLANISGTAMTAAGGDNFANVSNGDAITINGVANTVQTKNSNTSITLGTSAGTQTGVIWEDDTFQAYTIYSKAFNFPYEAFFKYGSRTTLFAADPSNPVIYTYDMTDWLNGAQTTMPTKTTYYDFRTPTNGQYNCLPAGFTSLSTSVGGESANGTIVMIYSSTSGQGSSGMVYVVAYVPGKGCAMWRTDTGAVTTDPGFSGGSGLTCTANGCTGTVTTTDRFTDHNGKIGLNDNTDVVTGTTCLSSSCQTLFPTAVYFWTVGTTTVGLQSSGARIGGHDCTGYSTYWNQPGTNHIWQFATRQLSNLSSASNVIPLSLFPTFPSTGVGISDGHMSCNNMDIADSNPFIWTSIAYPSGSPANNWTSAFTLPAGMTEARDMALNTRNGHWYVIDRLSGFWVFSNGVWAQQNTGLPNCTSSNVCGWAVKYDAIHDQEVIGLCNTTNAACTGSTDTPKFYRSSNEGASWTQIPTPVTIHDFPAYNLMDVAGNGNMVLGAYFGQNGTCGSGYSTDGGVTTTGYSTSTCPTNLTAPAPGGVYSVKYNPILNVMMFGTEQNGVLCSSDNGLTWSNMSPPDSNFTGGISRGNVREISYDSSGNPIMGTQDGLYKASGGIGCSGWTWTQTALEANGANTISVVRDAKGNIYWAHQKDSLTSSVHWPVSGTGQSGVCSIYVSTDGGLTGSPFCTGLPTRGSPVTGYEPWRIIFNPFDGMMYALIQDPSTNAGLIYKTVLDNNGLAPYGWQNELLAVTPATGVTHRFSHTFTNPKNQLFQTSIASFTESQDGRYALMNSDWGSTLGSEIGTDPCLPQVNCRGDVFVVEEK